MSAELDAERQRVADLTRQVAALNESLEAERGNRDVDHSHHVDDYETLCTRVLRQLSEQADLLADGLSAADVRQALAKMSAEYSSAAVTMGHLALKRAIRHAEANDLVNRNVAALADTPRARKADRPSP